MNQQSGRKIWFPAKRYGWGWGLPVAWQGWLVLASYVVLLLAGKFYLLSSHHVLGFVVYVLILTMILVVICRYKGEPAKWRWGGQ